MKDVNGKIIKTRASIKLTNGAVYNTAKIYGTVVGYAFGKVAYSYPGKHGGVKINFVSPKKVAVQ